MKEMIANVSSVSPSSEEMRLRKRNLAPLTSLFVEKLACLALFNKATYQSKTCLFCRPHEQILTCHGENLLVDDALVCPRNLVDRTLRGVILICDTSRFVSSSFVFCRQSLQALIG